MAAKTIKAPPVVEPTEPTIRDLYALTGRANPTVEPTGMPLSDFFRLLGGGVRRYHRLEVEAPVPYDVWVEYRENDYWVCQRDPMKLDLYTRSVFHGSPARPVVRISPVSYAQMARVSPLNDVAVCWATFPVELDRNNQRRLPYPPILKSSRDRVRSAISEFEVPVWGVLDAGDSITAIWRLHEVIPPSYAAIICDRISLHVGAKRLGIHGLGPERALATMMAQKGNQGSADLLRAGAEEDERRHALTSVLWPAPGQAAPVSPRHLVDITILGDSSAGTRIETLAQWVMPSR